MSDEQYPVEDLFPLDIRELELTERIERLERDVARMSAHLDGAAVTLARGPERIRPPTGPDLSLELQRIVAARSIERPKTG
jgi:hypothetical protein